MASNDGNYVVVDRSGSLPSPSSPWSIVVERFDETLSVANSMLDLLIGDDGESGFLGQLNDSISSAPSVSIPVDEITTDITITDIGSAPTFSDASLSDYPTDEYSAPSLDDVPTIDTSILTEDDAPADVDPSISWSESSLETTVYTPLLARLLNDLTAGATGLDEDVEDAIWDRALARQALANDRAYQKVLNDVSSRNFSMPSGALTAALNELATDQLAQETDVNNTITIQSSDLAQKNSRFAIEQAGRLEDLIRRTKEAKDQVSLDYSKSVADLVLKTYAEKIKAYVAKMEAKRAYIAAQVENLRGVIESNKGKIDIFREQYAALKVQVEAVTSKNQGLIDVYTGKVNAYGEKARAALASVTAQVESLRGKVAVAELEVRAATEEARASMEGYKSENELKIAVSRALSEITAQSVASAFAAVNANASLGYSAGESQSESWSHHDSLGESHTYQHDPDA